MRSKIAVVSVRLSLSAEDWQLTQFWTHGAQMLAKVLNATVADAYAQHVGAPWVRQVVQAVLDQPEHKQYGAGDAEPRCALEDVLVALYPARSEPVGVVT